MVCAQCIEPYVVSLVERVNEAHNTRSVIIWRLSVTINSLRLLDFNDIAIVSSSIRSFCVRE